MIDVECPHCKRVLKVPEKYIGVEGACKYCGGRLIISGEARSEEFEPSSYASPEPASSGFGPRHDTIPAAENIEVLNAQLAQNRRDIERLAKALETERVARIEAEVSRDSALARVKRSEENLLAIVGRDEDATLRSELERAQAKASQSRTEAERLAKELEAERVARAEAEVARDIALVRTKRLDINLAAIAEKGEEGALRAEFERSEAQLAQSRSDVARLANELETERAARVRAETAYRMMEHRTRRVQEQFRRLLHERTTPRPEAAAPGPHPEVMTPVPETTPAHGATTEPMTTAAEPVRVPTSTPESVDILFSEPASVSEDALELDVDSLVPSDGELDEAVAVGNPELAPETPPAPDREPVVEAESPIEIPVAPVSKPKRAWAAWAAAALLLVGIAACVAAYFTKPLWIRPTTFPAPPSANLADSGMIEASVVYLTSRQPDAPTVPASGARLAVARQQFDAKGFQELIQEAGVPQDAWAGFAQWFCVAEPDIPDAKSFPATGVPENAVLIEARKTLAAFADTTGREAFNKRLGALFSFNAPKDWAEETANEAGVVTVRNLVPGRYALVPRPDGPREAWTPIDPATSELTPVVVRQGETARCTIKLVDTASTIRGQVTDVESGKPVPKITLAVSGDITTEKKLTVVTKEDGSFTLDPLDTGYGTFSLVCTALPKGYLTSTTFSGTRDRGVALAPGSILLSKKAVPKETKKTTLSGRVLTSAGTPAAGFGVWVVGEDGSAKSLARSGRDGTYEFPHTGGTLRLYAAGPGSARTEPVAVELQASQSATRDFVLPMCGRIVLSIKKPDGTAPDAFEECNLVCASRVISDPAMLQRDGDMFVISYLAAGVYDLSFRVKGFKPVSLPGTTIDTNGGEHQLSVTLEPLEAPPVQPPQ